MQSECDEMQRNHLNNKINRWKPIFKLYED